MLAFLRGKVGVRKLRLFGVACCRRIEPRMIPRRYVSLVEPAEQFADSRYDEEQDRATEQAVFADAESPGLTPALWAAVTSAFPDSVVEMWPYVVDGCEMPHINAA